MGNYPTRRSPHFTYWRLRPNASVDAAPLPPKTADRTKRIRQLFFDLGGHCTLDDIGQAASDAGLLDGLGTDRSARETVKAALRPIATTNYWETAERAAQLGPQSARG